MFCPYCGTESKIAEAKFCAKCGKRHGKPVVYVVKSGEMHEDGYVFFRSVNGVWLTKEVPVKFLIKE